VAAGDSNVGTTPIWRITDQTPSTHEGFYLYLEPLPAGNHIIKWTATYPRTGGPLSQNITYKLKVLKGVPGQRQ
jgi:hypothetical protein